MNIKNLNYSGTYFSYLKNDSCVYKTFKNAFSRVLKIQKELLERIQIIEVKLNINKKNYREDKFIKTDKVYSYRDIMLLMKIRKIRKGI